MNTQAVTRINSILANNNYDPDEAGLQDLLTDVMLYAHDADFDWEYISQMANAHFITESAPDYDPDNPI